MWVPILGWFVGAIWWSIRSRPIVAHIKTQLEKRPTVGEDGWSGDSRRRAFGRWLSSLIAQEMSWPNDRFFESDPLEILCWSHDDGLDFDFVIHGVEDRIGKRLTKEQIEQLAASNLGAAVDMLLPLEAEALAA